MLVVVHSAGNWRVEARHLGSRHKYCVDGLAFCCYLFEEFHLETITVDVYLFLKYFFRWWLCLWHL